MPLPDVTREKILTSLDKFDREYRNDPQWIGWEQRSNQKYALVHDGRLYPPKVIISIATDIPRNHFHGGNQSNSYLQKRGFKTISIASRNEVDTLPAVTKINEAAPSLYKPNDNPPKYFSTPNDNQKMVIEIYRLLNGLQRHNFSTDRDKLPANGIYFFFEKGEVVEDKSFERVVRIGINTSDDTFKKRIRSHFRGNKRSSIFRKHVGGAVILKCRLGTTRLNSWLDKKAPIDKKIEQKVSEIFKDNFSFVCIKVQNREDRIDLEKGLIALFAQHPLGQPSEKWLGWYVKNDKIKRSGLWNVDDVEAEPLSKDQFFRLNQLINSYNPVKIKNNKNALILIPCCKSKNVSPSKDYLQPLTGLQPIREELLNRILDTPRLAEKIENRRGILNSEADYTRAVDLYTGNFYSAAGEALEVIANDGHPSVHVLIVSACYGVVQLNEGIKEYELQMSDTLNGNMKLYRYWRDSSLWEVILNYIRNNDISHIWSLLPNQFPYQQVIKKLWAHTIEKGIQSFHVQFLNAGSGTSFKRAHWLKQVIVTDPNLLISNSGAHKRAVIPANFYKYVQC